MTRPLPPVFVIALGLALGCDYFPPELVEDAGVPTDGGMSFPLAETCVGDVPMITEGLDDVLIDLTTLADDISDIGFCTGADAPGNDGFFGVDMEAGDKWHFHLRTTSDEMRNPAIYVLDAACDSRRCMSGDAIDVCGEGRDEHLSFVAPSTGRYFVGVDSRLTGGATYHLLALRPTCGNEDVEHSETCDDGNAVEGDGCDSSCRVELPHPVSGMAEVEPNDDVTGANHLLSADGIATGRLGGRCDRDVFLFELDAPQEVELALEGAAGVACNESAPLFTFELVASNGTSRIATGAVEAGEFCPRIQPGMLPAGSYYVFVSTDESERPFDYTLSLR